MSTTLCTTLTELQAWRANIKSHSAYGRPLNVRTDELSRLVEDAATAHHLHALVNKPEPRECAKKRFVQAGESELRTLAVVDLASVLGTDGFEGPLDEALEDFAHDVLDLEAVDPSLEVIVNALRAHQDFPHFVGEILEQHQMYGVLVQFGTLIRKYVTASSWQSSWGRRYTRWFYAETFEEAWALGLQWADQRHTATLKNWTARQDDPHHHCRLPTNAAVPPVDGAWREAKHG